MADYSSLYRAKLVQSTSTVLTVFVPQVFGDVSIDVTEWIGTPIRGMGWLFFQAGNPEHPVWMSPQGGGGGGGDSGGSDGGGGSSGNLDGGTANSVYGGIPPFDAGGVT